LLLRFCAGADDLRLRDGDAPAALRMMVAADGDGAEDDDDTIAAVRMIAGCVTADPRRSDGGGARWVVMTMNDR
jgi:hypothetical protein